MIELRQAISNLISATDNELDGFLELCYKKSFSKKTILSDDNDYIKEVYFIRSGLLRVKVIDIEGNNHTIHFASENQFIADYRAFLTNSKSKYQLEALENTDTMVLPKKALEWGYKNMKEGEKLGRLIAEQYFIYLDSRIEHLYTLSPIQRYDLMKDIFPNIHNRVPQHMIASYLGITPIHLSRIKKDSSKL